MTKKELMAILEPFPDDMVVALRECQGDYNGVTTDLNPGVFKYSDLYSDSGGDEYGIDGAEPEERMLVIG